MKLSVIVCTKNRADQLKNVIKNIIDQYFKDWELIIVEGESYDSTHSMLLSMYEKGAIKYASNSGTYLDARNIGLSLAEGEYVTFIDDDDIIIDNKFENQIKILDENPDISVLSSSTIFNSQVGLGFTMQDHNHEEIAEALKTDDIMQLINFQSCIFRKSDIDKLFKNNQKSGYFYKELENGGAEYAFLYTLFFSGAKFENTAQTIYVYRLGENKNSLSKSLSFDFYKNNIENKSLPERKKIIADLYNSYRDNTEFKLKRKRGRPKKNS